MPCVCSSNKLALSSCKCKPSINNRWAEKPLRDEYPPHRHYTQSKQPPDPFGGYCVQRARGGVGEQEEEVGEGHPCPALLDEVPVEYVAFGGKV